jgi:D-alanine-D-alanine ligase
MFAQKSQRLDSLKVAVLAGGESDERAVSLESGAAVSLALERRGHAVTQIDPAERDVTSVAWNGFDVAFLALHGRFGEDGQVQELLDASGVCYTGSDAHSSRTAFSKSAAKERFIQSGVLTPPYVLIHQSDAASLIQKHARKIGFPLVVKPDAQGSSLGVSLVGSPDELPQALARCFHFDPFGLLEAAVIGTEWTVGLLDEQPLPLIQIATERVFFDYHAKYKDESTEYRFEFDIEPDVAAAIQSAGCLAGRTLRTRGLARVDIRLDRFQQPWVLEVNTNPGLTQHSLIPMAAARIGMDLGELCERSIRSCLADSARPRQHPIATAKAAAPGLTRARQN